MADDTSREDQELPEEDDSFKFESDANGSDDGGLGNLPPLSDFDSEEGGEADSGGLPPIEDITIETPMPTGGNIKPPPPGYEDKEDEEAIAPSDPFAASPVDSGLDTPEPKEATGFQDLAADSDFSPETPEIGPGPDSDVETPLFDSAFGAGEGGFASDVETPAPTQAMETPMFAETPSEPAGAQPETPAFDEGAFGPAASDQGFDAGTPIPDFSPDTGVPGKKPEKPAPPRKRKAKARGGGVGVLVSVLIVLLGIAAGVFAGPWVAGQFAFIPNPARAKLDDANMKLADLEDQLERIRKMQPEGQPTLSRDEIQQLIQQKEGLTGEINILRTQRSEAENDLIDKTKALASIEDDIELKTAQYIDIQEELEALQDELTIVRARQQGLQAEVERLTDLVGGLEKADARRVASKKTLEHDLQRLAIMVREGIPLTPEKFSREERLARVQSLQTKVAAVNWVTPEILDEYTSLYQDELAISASHEYFFARIPVSDRFDTVEMRWAECLMNGNWSVYYRTIDDKHVGVFANTATEGAPNYEFREATVSPSRGQVEQAIRNARVDDYRKKLVLIQQKQELREPKSTLQQRYESL